MRTRFFVGMTLLGMALGTVGCGSGDGGSASDDGPPAGGFTAPGAPAGEEAPKASTKKR